MGREDLDINRNVRRVFVKHWLDLGRLFVRSTNCALSIRGILQRIPGMKDRITPQVVDSIFMEVKRVKFVKRVNIDLDNWINESGAWKPYEKIKAKKAPPKSFSSGSKMTHHITEKPSPEDDEILPQ